MSRQAQRLAALAGGARTLRGLRAPPLARRVATPHSYARATAFPAATAIFPVEQRHISTGGGAAPELGNGLDQLTDAAAAVAGSSASSEPLALVQGVQSALEAVHVHTGLPWWATLLVSGVALRATLFPFYVYQIRATQRLMQARTDFSKLYSAFKYARTFLPPNDRTAHLQAILLGRKGVKAVMAKYNTRPVQTILGSIAYIPMFMVVGYSARSMIRSGNFEGLDVGGLLLWQNLMETDSTFVLPALAVGSTYLNLELSVRNKSAIWTTILQGGQYLTLLALPVVSTIPQGVFFYWLGASWASMAQTIAMNDNEFRKRIGLKPRVTPPPTVANEADALSSETEQNTATKGKIAP